MKYNTVPCTVLHQHPSLSIFNELSFSIMFCIPILLFSYSSSAFSSIFALGSHSSSTSKMHFWICSNLIIQSQLIHYHWTTISTYCLFLKQVHFRCLFIYYYRLHSKVFAALCSLYSSSTYEFILKELHITDSIEKQSLFVLYLFHWSLFPLFLYQTKQQ